MSKLYETLSVVAPKMVELEDLSRKAHGRDEQGLGPMLSREELRKTEEGKTYLKKKRELESEMQRYAADPDFRLHMQCWMIDFEGKEAIIRGDACIDDLSQEDVDKAIRADFGVLPKRIWAWCGKHGFEISDSSSGSDGWQLGVPCNGVIAERLCRLAHLEFKNFIESGELEITLKFWGWKFTELDTVYAAREFLKKKVAS